MTTIHDLPQELLSEVFKNLELYELFEVQNVCHNWYLPAHVLFLKDVYLNSGYEIKEFNASIDQNTSVPYLAAVEKIKIRSCDGYSGVDYNFDKEDIEKLLCRFPNLTHVSIYSESSICLLEFNEELCQTIAKKCPKLHHFEVIMDGEYCKFNKDGERNQETTYCGTLSKFRPLLTAMKMCNIGTASGFGGATNFVSTFPRLQRIYGLNNPLNNFREYLFIIEQLSNLTSISFEQYYNYVGEEEDFVEKYLATKSKEQQNLIIERLSKVTNLTYIIDRSFCPNTIKFITKYLTSLNDLRISCSFRLENWTAAHQQLLLDNMTRLDIKDRCSISLHNILLPVLADFLPMAVHRLFSRLPSYNRTLKLEVKEWHGPEESIDLDMEWPKKPEITIASTSSTAAYSITSTVFKDQFRDIDQFVFFIIERSHYTIDIGIDTYNTILKAIPALTKVTFDIPKSYKDIVSSEEIYHSPLLETLTLRPCFNVEIQSMLDTYALMFPNLKYLNLYYYDGVWKQELREVYVNLNGYTLEQLVFDMTPIRRTMKEDSLKGDLFVVQVETLEQTERFTMSLDLSSVARNSNEGSQVYVCVYITVSSLERLDLCMYSENDYYEEYLHHLYNDQPKRITIFK